MLRLCSLHDEGAQVSHKKVGLLRSIFKHSLKHPRESASAADGDSGGVTDPFPIECK